MARSGGLREFQENLARRLADASAQDTLRSRLAFESGERLWLLRLPDAGEVMPVPWLCKVPLTQRWYNGLVNVRGSLHGVVDLADFCGYGVTPHTNESAFLLCGQRYGLNVGLLVRKVVGLRNAQDFSPVSKARPDKLWISGIVSDQEGREYREINMAGLLRDPVFMDISAGAARGAA
jgi:twitching motility protein PilI